MYEVEGNFAPYSDVTTSNNLAHIFSDVKNADISIYNGPLVSAGGLGLGLPMDPKILGCSSPVCKMV